VVVGPLAWQHLVAFSRRGGAIAVIGATLAAGAIVAGGIYQPNIPIIQGGSETANLWVDSNGGTCTRQVAGAYVDAQACSTFQAAYTAASCGDTVRVVTGSYGSQTISTGSKTTCNSRIKFTATNGYSLTAFSVSVRAVWIDNATVNTSSGWSFEPGGNLGELSNSDISNTAQGAGGAIFGADNVLITSNSFNGTEVTANGIEIYDDPAGSTPDNWVVSNNSFTGYHFTAADPHSQALYLGYSTNGLVEGNTFNNNGDTSHIFVTWFGNLASSPSSDPHDICIRGNTFTNQVNGLSADVNFRAELNAATDNISVDPDQSTDNGLDDSTGHVRNC
jgi:hypothetical protein